MRLQPQQRQVERRECQREVPLGLLRLLGEGGGGQRQEHGQGGDRMGERSQRGFLRLRSGGTGPVYQRRTGRRSRGTAPALRASRSGASFGCDATFGALSRRDHATNGPDLAADGLRSRSLRRSRRRRPGRGRGCRRGRGGGRGRRRGGRRRGGGGGRAGRDRRGARRGAAWRRSTASSSRWQTPQWRRTGPWPCSWVGAWWCGTGW